MSNIVSYQAPRAHPVVRIEQRAPLWRRVGFFAVSLARACLFLVLLWLRLPVTIICSLISVPMMFAFFFALYAFPERHAMVVMLGVMSFVSFAAMWLYDSLLMVLSPQETVRIL